MQNNNKPHLVGGVGKKNFGNKYHQGDRVYDSNAIAVCLTSSPAGGTGGQTCLYLVQRKRKNKMNSYKFDDFQGEHILQGVERCYLSYDSEIQGTRDTSAVKFRMDNQNYVVYCDPDDGYRSYCSGIYEIDSPPKYTFPDTAVLCKIDETYSNDYEYQRFLIFTDKVTNEMVLEIGTYYYDSYYPMCHFEYHPENLYCNKNK